jgi:uncharacterized iron-regulated membrane protein
MMQKQNYVRFILMSVFSIIMVVSGFIVWFILPRGGEGFRGGREALVTRTEFLSLERHVWLNLHNWIGIALLVTVVIHVIVHRKWIAYMTRKLFVSNKS